MRRVPTLTDSFFLSFVFFLLSDIHQIVRDPSIENLLRILTSLQFTARSPFDYPAFLFLSLVIINLIAILIARLRSPEPKLFVTNIPLGQGQVSLAIAEAEALHLGNTLEDKADKLSIAVPISPKIIDSEVGEYPEGRNEMLRKMVSDAIQGSDPPRAKIHESIMTDLLLSLSNRLGIKIGGMYHPLQDKISISPFLGPITRGYVYAHELFHSAGLGEVWAEIGAIQVCLSFSDQHRGYYEIFGLYLLVRSIASYLSQQGGLEKIKDNIPIAIGNSEGLGEKLIYGRKTRLESDVYLTVKKTDRLIRGSRNIQGG